MAEIKNWYLVCYDISDQKRWRTAYKLLKGYGRRMQLSIFRCRVSKRQLERMRWELEKILDSEDRLLITTLCDNCVAKMIVRNSFSGWDAEQPKFTIL
jgi:CRISPR-associated protein Cas2